MARSSKQEEIYKLPSMTSDEVEQLLASQRICRMALNDAPQPYIIVLDYVYIDGKMYFHFADYGRKMELIRKDPHVSVAVDRYNETVTEYENITLMGKLTRVRDPEEREKVAQALVKSIKARGRAKNVAARHGFDSIEKETLTSASSALYRLDVSDYIALKSPGL